MGTKGCKFCDKEGLLILPLRYAAVVGEASALADIPALPGTLGVGVKDLALTHGKYAPRMVRNGYIYLLQERVGKKYWEGYMVIDDAFLYKFDVSTPPISTVEFSCDRSTCGIDASCIAIDKVDQVTKAYFLYTPTPMTQAKLDEYKTNADSFVGKGKMQAFDPKAWAKAGSKSQEHSLKPELIGQHVTEWLLFKKAAAVHDSSLGKVMGQQLFPALNAAYAGLPPIDANGTQVGRLGILLQKLKEKEAAAFVLHDHIGITQELNDFRNSKLEGIENYLAAIDQYGASNQQRLQVYEAINEVKDGLHAGVVQSSQRFLDNHRAQSDSFWDRQRQQARDLRAAGNETDAKKIESDIEKSIAIRDENYRKYFEANKADAAKRWKDKYESRLDIGEMDRFYKKLKSNTQSAYETVDARSEQHLRWFEADRLVNAFDTYDTKDAIAGYSFALHSALCTYGIAGCNAAEDKLDEWIKSPSVLRKNLYMRGLYYNQTELIEAAKKANDDIEVAVGTVEYASAITAAHMIKATKGLVDGFKKIDSAFDEWARNQTQAYSKKWSKSLELILYHKASDLTRTVFRAGLGGKFDKKLTAKISGLLYARLGPVTQLIAFDEILLKIPQEKIAAHQRARATQRAEERRVDKATSLSNKVASQQIEGSLEALVADAQAKAQSKVKLTLEQIKGMTKADLPTNNYHQTRMGVILGCIEMIALGEKFTHFEPNTKGFLEVGGSTMAVGSIVLDAYYSAAKSIREISPYSGMNAIDKGADIVRGGFKLGAGVLGLGAGLCGATLDYMKWREEKNRALAYIYAARAFSGFISAGLTISAAFSYAGPLLNHLARGYASHSLRYRALIATAGLAARIGARVRLLVWVARFNWVGLALTLGEIGYLYFKDDDLQNWCEKSVFRKNKTYTNWLGARVTPESFTDATKELEELEKASQVIGAS
jgi:hypothetical protein